MAYVYIHKKPKTSEIFYIGIATNKSRCYTKSARNDHWSNTYNKYGMIVDIISDNISLEGAKEMEKFLIASYGLENLCNMTLGGEGAFGLKHSEETKQKLRKANLGKPSALKGRKYSEERKKRMSEISKGMKMPMSQRMATKKRMQNFKHSEETKAKMKKAKEGYKFPKEVYMKGVEARQKNAMKIKELTTGFVGTAKEIAKEFNIPVRKVYKILNNNISTKEKAKIKLEFIKI